MNVIACYLTSKVETFLVQLREAELGYDTIVKNKCALN